MTDQADLMHNHPAIQLGSRLKLEAFGWIGSWLKRLACSPELPPATAQAVAENGESQP